jgi:glucose/arabinose dehydrogenase
MRRLAVVLAALVLFGAVAAACAPPRTTVTTVVSGLDHPWDIGFLPNGTMLVTERAGRLDRVVSGQAQLVAAPADVVAASEAGMLGLAVDPQFASNGFVFVCMASSAGTTTDVRVVRFTLSANGTSVLARQDVLTGLPFSSGRHSGCRPRFGPDGALWVGTGDSATGTVPQDPNSLGGKVLRINRDGTPASGNPSGRTWYTRGHRNVQGLAFRPSDGMPFEIEHGTDRDDEINVLQAGGNYGWDPVPGYDESQPMTDLIKFPQAVVAKWSSGTPTIAPSGATFVSGSQWSIWNGALAVAVLKAQQLRVFFTLPNGNVTGSQTALTTYGRLRSVVQGPDGNLYVSTDNGNNADVVLRVTPTP